MNRRKMEMYKKRQKEYADILLSQMKNYQEIKRANNNMSDLEKKINLSLLKNIDKNTPHINIIGIQSPFRASPQEKALEKFLLVNRNDGHGSSKTVNNYYDSIDTKNNISQNDQNTLVNHNCSNNAYSFDLLNKKTITNPFSPSSENIENEDKSKYSCPPKSGILKGRKELGINDYQNEKRIEYTPMYSSANRELNKSKNDSLIIGRFRRYKKLIYGLN